MRATNALHRGGGQRAVLEILDAEFDDVGRRLAPRAPAHRLAADQRARQRRARPIDRLGGLGCGGRIAKFGPDLAALMIDMALWPAMGPTLDLAIHVDED